MADTIVREANRSDAQSVSSLFRDDGASIAPDLLRKKIVEMSQDRDSNRLLLAEHDGEVAGFLAVHVIPSPYLDGNMGLIICAFFVALAHRRKGIGTELFRAAEQFAEEKECTYGTLAISGNRRRDDAHKFYRKLGFEHICEIEKGATAFGKLLPSARCDKGKDGAKSIEATF